MRIRMVSARQALLSVGLGAVASVVIAFALDAGSDAPVEPELVSTSQVAGAVQVADPPATTTSTISTTTTTLPDSVETLRAVVEAMAPEDLARQLVVTGAVGTDMEATIERNGGSLCLGGLFVSDTAENFGGSRPEDARAAVGNLVAAAADDCRIQPLVVTDAEAGSVLRVPVEPMDSPQEFRAALDEGNDREATLGRLRSETIRLATELRDLGVHVSLGIVTDVDVDPGFYMARTDRTFGSDPGIVSEMVGEMVAGYCHVGVAAALKHFPNQAATRADPHSNLSRSANTIADWRARGRLPYRENLDAPLVLTGHIVYEDTDPENPASMSRAITTGLLREELGYGGVVITDELHIMGGAHAGDALAANRAVTAVEAGADLTLWIDSDHVGEIIEALTMRIREDETFRDQVSESVARILRLKARFGLVEGLDPTDFELCPPGEADLLARP